MNFELIKEIFRVRRSVFGALAVLAALVVGLYAYQALWQEPRLRQAQQAHLTGAATGQRVSERERALAYRNGLRDLALFDRRILPKKDFAKFLGELLDSAHANALTVKAISYKPALVKGQEMVSYDLSFTVSGRYPAVKRFIGEVCRLPQIVTVDSVTLSNLSKTEEAVDLRLQLTAFLKTEGA